MPLTVIVIELSALKSAMDPDVGKALKSTTRKRNRVTFAPVLFTKRRLTESVPFAALGNTVKSRTRFGDVGAPIVESSSNVGIDRFSRALARF